MKYLSLVSPEALTKHITTWTRFNVSPVNLFYAHDDSLVNGYDTTGHISIDYEFECETNNLKNFLNECKTNQIIPCKVRLKEISKYNLGDFDSISVAVESLDLRIMNKLMFSRFKHIKPKEFAPHITIAYVKKNMADDIVGNKHFQGITFESNEFYINMNDTDSTKFSIS